MIELRSRTDRLKTLLAKMDEYQQNGVLLGVLLDPPSRAVYLFRPGVAPVMLANPGTVFCDPELPGFVLDLTPIFR